MYIIKNALRCIGRSKGRNVLIGIIALVIAVSACIGLSIRQAAESARESALEEMSVTANISYNWSDSMNNMMNPFENGFDKDAFQDMMNSNQSLTLDEYKHYATASTVDGFYYTLTAYFNGSEEFESIQTSSGGGGQRPSMPGIGGPGSMDFGGASGDFTVIGFSGRNAMTDFVNGSAAILEGGAMFAEDTSELVCVISETLALYNELSVGDSVTITNPNSETEAYTLTVVGIYESSQDGGLSNSIYVSFNKLQAILDLSESVSTEYTNDWGMTSETKVTGSLTATYLFANTDDYDAFAEEVYTLGLDESYTVESSDLLEFEESLTLLETLGNMAGWFLIIILIIGGVILVVLNIFNVRERKYEVGVLTAMGMKKWKVAAQFICEILVVTMLAVIIGAGIGAVSSVPITNALLSEQMESQNNKNDRFNSSFDPSGMFGSDLPDDIPDDFGGGKNPFQNMISGTANYITEVDSAMNLTVVFQMIGVGLLLTFIASTASVMFIMRYDPLKILANRD